MRKLLIALASFALFVPATSQAQLSIDDVVRKQAKESAQSSSAQPTQPRLEVPARTAPRTPTETPVRADPNRPPRYLSCVQFERTKPTQCNFVPGTSGTRNNPDCRTYRDNGGKVTIMCPEDLPGFYETQRVAPVARACGENSRDCIAAYFKRPHQECTYRVVPDHWQTGPYDVRVSSLPNEQGIILYRSYEGRSYRNYESQHARQLRYALSNERNPYRWSDPCKGNGYQ